MPITYLTIQDGMHSLRNLQRCLPFYQSLRFLFFRFQNEIEMKLLENRFIYIYIYILISDMRRQFWIKQKKIKKSEKRRKRKEIKR